MSQTVLLVDDEPAEGSHDLEIGKSRIDEVYEADIVEQAIHSAGQRTIRIEVRFIHREVRTINGE